MAKNSPSATAGEMLDSLKARLGFSRGDEAPAARYDEELDRDDDGYSERWDDEYAGYGADYDENAPIGAYRPARVGSGRQGRMDSSPNLVSIDDVKANTPVPGSLLRDPLDGASASRASRRSTSRDLIDGTAPAQSSPAYNARKRSEGLDSLFEPSGASARAGQAHGSSYDPYVAYSSSQPAAHVASRSLKVIRPVAYDDVERVAKAVKGGDVVVLALRSAADDLAKRILDFSFGVASALDASVECPAPKVFAIARGGALTEDEKRALRVQGVL